MSVFLSLMSSIPNQFSPRHTHAIFNPQLEISNIGTGNTPTLATLPPDLFDSFANKVSGEDLVKPVADEDGRAEELVRIIRDPSAKLLDGPVLLLDGDVARPERLDGLV